MHKTLRLSLLPLLLFFVGCTTADNDYFRTHIVGVDLKKSPQIGPGTKILDLPTGSAIESLSESSAIKSL